MWVRRVRVVAPLRRLRCPDRGVVAEAVPFTRPGAHLARDFDDLITWLATRTDKTAIARLCRISWRTVGRACERVVATELDPGCVDGLFRIGRGGSHAFWGVQMIAIVDSAVAPFRRTDAIGCCDARCADGRRRPLPRSGLGVWQPCQARRGRRQLRRVRFSVALSVIRVAVEHYASATRTRRRRKR